MCAPYLEDALSHRLLHADLDGLAVLCQLPCNLASHFKHGSYTVDVHFRVQLWDGAPADEQATWQTGVDIRLQQQPACY